LRLRPYRLQIRDVRDVAVRTADFRAPTPSASTRAIWSKISSAASGDAAFGDPRVARRILRPVVGAFDSVIYNTEDSLDGLQIYPKSVAIGGNGQGLGPPAEARSRNPEGRRGTRSSTMQLRVNPRARGCRYVSGTCRRSVSDVRRCSGAGEGRDEPTAARSRSAKALSVGSGSMCGCRPLRSTDSSTAVPRRRERIVGPAWWTEATDRSGARFVTELSRSLHLARGLVVVSHCSTAVLSLRKNRS
jgi:hypothetical protein